jgi:oligosaccharide repeat unit polymerase
MNFKVILAGQLLLSILLMFSIIVVSFIDKTEYVVLYTQTFLFIVFFWTLFAQIILNGLMHLYSIFLFLFFLFLLSIPFCDWLNIMDINKKYLFRYAYLSDDIYVEVCIYSALFLLFTFWGGILGYKNKETIKNNEINYNSYLFTVGLLFFIFAFPGILIKYYLQIQVILEKGYLAVFDGSLQQIRYPIICTGAGTLLILGYCFIISSKPSKKQYLIITILFLLTQIINVIKGQRSVLIFPVIFAVWFYYKFYKEKIPVIKMLFIVLFVVILGQVISMSRNKNDVMKSLSFSGEFISSFFEEQGVSFFVFPYIFHYEIENDRYPYILAPLNIKTNDKPQNMERLTQGNFVADQLMYRMLPHSYLSGYGTGSSILALFYDLPLFIAMLLCLVFGFFIARFEIFLKKSRILLLFSFYIVFSVIASPRYEFFQFFYAIIMLGIMYLFVNIIYLSKNQNIKSYEKQ